MNRPKAYHEAVFLAAYHRWSAARNFPPAGNNPLNGRPYPKFSYEQGIHRGAGAVADKALARHYLQVAREIRQST